MECNIMNTLFRGADIKHLPSSPRSSTCVTQSMYSKLLLTLHMNTASFDFSGIGTKLI